MSRPDSDLESVERQYEKAARVVPYVLLVVPLVPYLLSQNPTAGALGITAYLGGNTDSHKNAEIRGLLAPLAALAAKYGVALVLVTHCPKRDNGPAIHRIIGSIAFAAAARAV